MSNGLKLFFEALKLNQAECIALIQKGEKDGAFIRFIQYLFFLFPIREKLGLDDEECNIVLVLRQYYNIIKHKGNIDAIMGLHNFHGGELVMNKSGELLMSSDGMLLMTRYEMRFGELIDENLLNKRNDKTKYCALYKNYLKDCSVQTVLEKLTNDLQQEINKVIKL